MDIPAKELEHQAELTSVRSDLLSQLNPPTAIESSGESCSETLHAPLVGGIVLTHNSKPAIYIFFTVDDRASQ